MSKFAARNRGPGARPELKYVDCYDTFQQGTAGVPTKNAPFFNFSIGGASIIEANQSTPTLGSVYGLNCTTEGTSDCQRVGRRITMKSIEIRILPFVVGDASVDSNIPTSYRIMLLYDKQFNKTLPAISDVLAARHADASLTNNIFGPINMANRDRFLVLRDVLWTNDSELASANTSVSTLIWQMCGVKHPKKIHWYIKLKGLETLYSTSTNALTSINSGALYLFCLCDSQTNPGVMNFTLSSRLRFYD